MKQSPSYSRTLTSDCSLDLRRADYAYPMSYSQYAPLEVVMHQIQVSAFFSVPYTKYSVYMPLFRGIPTDIASTLHFYLPVSSLSPLNLAEHAFNLIGTRTKKFQRLSISLIVLPDCRSSAA